MRYRIEVLGSYLRCTVTARETADDMRELLHAVRSACREHGCPKVLLSVRNSRAIFKPEDYGFDGKTRGYVGDLASAECRIALLGDSPELHAAHEYIEVVARQQKINARAFREEPPALRWLQDAPEEPGRRYRFTRIVLLGAPTDAGVYALWDRDELVYYGRASGEAGIRARLLSHLDDEIGGSVSHYSWEICADPAQREAELIAEYRRVKGRPPRFNAS